MFAVAVFHGVSIHWRFFGEVFSGNLKYNITINIIKLVYTRHGEMVLKISGIIKLEIRVENDVFKMRLETTFFKKIAFFF